VGSGGFAECRSGLDGGSTDEIAIDTRLRISFFPLHLVSGRQLQQQVPEIQPSEPVDESSPATEGSEK